MKINPIGHLVKTNPIQTQSKPISEKAKMNANAFSQKDYENVTAFRPKKTNPIKANFTYPQRGKTEVRCRMSEVRYLSSVFCLLFSVFCLLSSVFCPWAPGSLLANQA